MTTFSSRRTLRFRLLALMLALAVSACGERTPEPQGDGPPAHVVVATSDGIPLANASIELFRTHDPTFDATPTPAYAVTTDGAGRARLTAEAGTYDFVVTKGSLGAVERDVPWDPASSRVPVAITVRHQAEIRGWVRLADDTKPVDVRIHTHGLPFAATTAADGSFFLRVPAGRYRLLGTRAGFEVATVEVDVGAAESRLLEHPLVLQPLVLPPEPEDDAGDESDGPSVPKPILFLSTSTLDLHSRSSAAEHRFTLRNDGGVGSVLAWAVATDGASADWLSVRPTAGTLDGGLSRTVTIQVDPAVLTTGETVEGFVRIASDGGNADLRVRFTKTVGGLDTCGTYPLDGAPELSVTSHDATPRERWVPGRLLVAYRTSIAAPVDSGGARGPAERVRRMHGLDVLRNGHGSRPDIVAVPPGQELAFARRLRADPAVLYAHPDYFLATFATPMNDPLFPHQWNLTGFGVPAAWTVQAGSADVIVAVIDDGVDLTHPDFAGRVLPGCDFHYGTNDPRPGANAHHGTHVAGIIAAQGNNGIGVVGVAPANVRILPIKVFGNTERELASVSMVSDAIRWAAGLPLPDVAGNPHPARIVNLSLGAIGTFPALDAAVDEARDLGVIVIAASGNGSSSTGIASPASNPRAFAVGSVDANVSRSPFSNYQTTPGGRTVDVVAPGGVGAATVPCPNGSIPSTFNRGTYGCMSGTSMAAPFVSGAAALLWSQHPTWTDEQILTRIRETAWLEPSMSPLEYGAGVTCIDHALGTGRQCGR